MLSKLNAKNKMKTNLLNKNKAVKLMVKDKKKGNKLNQSKKVS